MFHLNFLSTRVPLLISYLAYIWSQMRHICCNYFGFKNLKPRLRSFGKADASIIAYPRASKKEDQRQCIAEWDDVKFAPLGCLIPKPLSQQDRLGNKECTFSLDMGDNIFDALLKSDCPRILYHHVEPSRQG